MSSRKLERAIILIDHQNFKKIARNKSEKYSLDHITNFLKPECKIEEIYFFGSANNENSVITEIEKYFENKPENIIPIPCLTIDKITNCCNKIIPENTADFEIYLKTMEILYEPTHKDINTIIIVSSDKDFYLLCKKIKKLGKKLIVIPYDGREDYYEEQTVSPDYLLKLANLGARVIPYSQIKQVLMKTNSRLS